MAMARPRHRCQSKRARCLIRGLVAFTLFVGLNALGGERSEVEPIEVAPLAKPPVKKAPPPNLGTDRPAAEAAPPAPSLVPQTPELSEPGAKPEEVTPEDRVVEWTADAMAEGRARTGGGDPYFGLFRERLEKAFAEGAHQAAGFAEQTRQGLAALGDAEKQYGRTGSALAPKERLDEEHFDDPGSPLMREADGVGASGKKSALTPAASALRDTLHKGETLRAYGDGKLGTGFTAEVDVRQRPDGSLVSADLVRSSGNPAFDEEVLAAIPRALSGMPAPSSRTLRSRWSFEGRYLHKKKLKDMNLKDDGWYLGAAAVAGALLTGHVDETTGDVEVVDLRTTRIACRVRLLRAY